MICCDKLLLSLYGKLMNIDDFISSNKSRSKKSIFDEHLEDINKLLELNYSQKQVIEYLKVKCKNKTGLRESKNRITTELKNINQNKVENTLTENIEKKPIDIFANLKGTNSKTSLEQDMLDFVKKLEE